MMHAGGAAPPPSPHNTNHNNNNYNNYNHASRHISIQIAACVIVVCTVVNVSVFVQKINTVWTDNTKNRNTPPAALQEKMVRGAERPLGICILIPEDNPFIWEFTLPDLSDTIDNNEEGFGFSVFINNDGSQNATPTTTSLERTSWFVHNFPIGSSLQFIRAYGNETVFSTLFSAASIHGTCTYYFAVGRHTRFVSRGWAVSLVSALRTFNPPNLGAVSPSGCVNCLFVHDVHREIFAQHTTTNLDHNYYYYHYPPDICWAEWVRSIYSPCHLSIENSVIVHSFSNQSCELKDQPSNFSILIARGRLYVNKFISLGLSGFRDSVLTRVNG